VFRNQYGGGGFAFKMVMEVWMVLWGEKKAHRGGKKHADTREGRGRTQD